MKIGKKFTEFHLNGLSVNSDLNDFNALIIVFMFLRIFEFFIASNAKDCKNKIANKCRLNCR